MSYIDPYGRDEEPAALGARKRNLRGRFRATSRGLDALVAYRTAVDSARGGDDPRAALEQAQSSWAQERSLEPTDALVLGELESKAASIVELTRALDDCGVKRPAVQSGIERLMDTGHAEVAASTRPE